MKRIGTFQSRQYGPVAVMRGTYGSHTGPTAIVLQSHDGEKLATLSVNMYKPDCSLDSRDLPRDCFYVKTWGGNEDLAAEAQASHLFLPRPDLPQAESGFVTAPAWQISGRTA